VNILKHHIKWYFIELKENITSFKVISTFWYVLFFLIAFITQGSSLTTFILVLAAMIGVLLFRVRYFYLSDTERYFYMGIGAGLTMLGIYRCYLLGFGVFDLGLVIGLTLICELLFTLSEYILTELKYLWDEVKQWRVNR